MATQEQILAELQKQTNLLTAIAFNTKPLRERYPDTLIAIWISTTADNTVITDAQQDAFITNSPTGFITELQELGQASSAPGTTTNSNVGNDPYSIAMRPVTDISRIVQAQDVYLKRLEWFSYDTTIAGGAGQDPATVADIYASRTSDDAFAQSLYQNGMEPVAFLPNWFRPQLRVNNRETFLGMTSSNYGSKTNQGDLSIGMPTPFCLPDIDLPLGSVNDITCYGQMAQYIDSQTKFQRYPVMCIGTFYLGYNRNPQSR